MPTIHPQNQPWKCSNCYKRNVEGWRCSFCRKEYSEEQRLADVENQERIARLRAAEAAQPSDPAMTDEYKAAYAGFKSVAEWKRAGG